MTKYGEHISANLSGTSSIGSPFDFQGTATELRRHRAICRDGTFQLCHAVIAIGTWVCAAMHGSEMFETDDPDDCIWPWPWCCCWWWWCSICNVQLHKSWCPTCLQFWICCFNVFSQNCLGCQWLSLLYSSLIHSFLCWIGSVVQRYAYSNQSLLHVLMCPDFWIDFSHLMTTCLRGTFLETPLDMATNEK